MATNNEYDIYDTIDKVFVADHLTHGEVKAFFGLKLTASSTAASRTLVKNRYLVSTSSEDPREWIRPDGTIIKPSLEKDIPTDFVGEWSQICAVFRKLEWVKQWEPGVKVLEPLRRR